MLIVFFDTEACAMVVCLSFVTTVVILTDAKINVYFSFFKQTYKCIVIKAGNLVSFNKFEFFVCTFSARECFCVNKLVLIFLFKARL